MFSNIFLKFSKFSLLDEDEHPFSNNYGATTSAVLAEFLSIEKIIEKSMDELINFICKKEHKSFPASAPQLLQTAARNSYRLDKYLFQALDLS